MLESDLGTHFVLAPLNSQLFFAHKDLSYGSTLGKVGRVVSGASCNSDIFLTTIGISALLLFTQSGKSMPYFINLEVFQLI